MKKKAAIACLGALIGFLPSLAQTAELLGAQESDVSLWAKEKGYTVNDTNRGTAGCRSGKQYVELIKGNLKIYALFFQPLYQEHSKRVTQVEFEPTAPVSMERARQWAVQVAPIVGTRPATHKQSIPVGNGPCDPRNGGFDERYTDDFLVEFHYAPGQGAVERIKVYNEGIR